MTREEQIAKASHEYCGEFCNPQPVGWLAFTKGAEWADEHPKSDMVHIDKVHEWIERYIGDATGFDSYTLTESFDYFLKNGEL